MRSTLTLDKLIDLGQCLHGDRCRGLSPFQLVGKGLGEWLDALLTELGVGAEPLIRGQVHGAAYLSGRIYVAEGAVVEPTAFVQGPCYIGPHAEVRHGAYVRGNVYIGPKAVVGHTTEAKGAMFFDEAKAGHFAYVGDSILGRDVNLGAGTKLANLPLRRGTIRVKNPFTGQIESTGLNKFSAVLGDRAQTGCNAVLSPGTILMPGAMVLPCAHVRGTIGSVD